MKMKINKKYILTVYTPGQYFLVIYIGVPEHYLVFWQVYYNLGFRFFFLVFRRRIYMFLYLIIER